ncbi:restriction endonuclease subunit S [Microbacterium aurum]
MSWHSAPLGEVCRIVSGATPKTGIAEYWGDEVPWITPADMSRDRSQTLTGGTRALTQAGLASCSARLVPPGSVVVSSRAPIGYVAIAGTELATNQGCKTAVPPEFIDSRYLYWFLVASRDDLERRSSGTTFKEISAKEFGRTSLRWPDIHQQRRIVDILEDHLSRLDAGVQSLDAAHRRFDGMRVTRVRQLLPPSTLEATLGSVTRRSGYGTSTKCVYDGPGAAVTRIPNLVGGRIDLSDLKRIADPAVSVTDLMLQEGDLLVIRTNGSRDLIGRSAVVQAGISASFASYLIRFQLDPTQVIPDWVHLMLSTPDVRRAIETRAASSAGQYNLSLAKLNTLSLPLPTIDEQATILSEMEALDATTIRLAATLRQAHHRAASLRRALLTAAFSGKLAGAASDSDRIEELAATT